MLIVVALFWEPTAGPSVKAIYGLAIVVAVLFPIEFVSRTSLLRLLGASAILAGAWFVLTTTIASWIVAAWFVIGAIALVLPEVVPDDAELQ